MKFEVLEVDPPFRGGGKVVDKVESLPGTPTPDDIPTGVDADPASPDTNAAHPEVASGPIAPTP
ncbi:MAG: hypothetical protein K8R60_18610 [Burkholderiales bacterium]|nr:hypothetical protein [Burkholderiales bacterium]